MTRHILGGSFHTRKGKEKDLKIFSENSFSPFLFGNTAAAN